MNFQTLIKWLSHETTLEAAVLLSITDSELTYYKVRTTYLLLSYIILQASVYYTACATYHCRLLISVLSLLSLPKADKISNDYTLILNLSNLPLHINCSLGGGWNTRKTQIGNNDMTNLGWRANMKKQIYRHRQIGTNPAHMWLERTSCHDAIYQLTGLSLCSF